MNVGGIENLNFFDSAFFQTHLAQLVGEYASQRNLAPEEVVISVTLTDGTQLVDVSHARVALGWVLLLPRDDSMHFVPMREVAHISVDRRTGSPPEKNIGFSVSPVEQALRARSSTSTRLSLRAYAVAQDATDESR